MSSGKLTKNNLFHSQIQPDDPDPEQTEKQFFLNGLEASHCGNHSKILKSAESCSQNQKLTGTFDIKRRPKR